MTLVQFHLIARRWLRNLISVRAITNVMSSFGVLWLVVEITDFFLEETTFPATLRGYWWLFGLVGVVMACAKCWPQLSVAHKLNGRDVTVEISIGDVFSFPGALVVGSNTTFDTQISRQLIAEDSVQGMFTRKYYADEVQLDNELQAGLGNTDFEQLQGTRKGKAKKYPVGTVVRLDQKSRSAYFLAIADINEHGVAEGSFDKLRDSLAELWVYVGFRGLKEPVVMPVLGTGFSRLTQTREEVVREIVRSFVAACSERVFTDRLTIVLSPRDVAKHHISFDELGSFLEHYCVYTEFSKNRQYGVGMPV